MTDLDVFLEVVAKDMAEFTASFDIYCLSLGDSQSVTQKVVPEKGLTPKPNESE